jgi:hypothetical protein
MRNTIKNKKTESNFFLWICIGKVHSMLFLTYSRSILAPLLVACRLAFSNKEFHLSLGKTKLILLFLSIYSFGIAGMNYTNNPKAALATLKTHPAIICFPTQSCACDWQEIKIKLQNRLV